MGIVISAAAAGWIGAATAAVGAGVSAIGQLKQGKARKDAESARAGLDQIKAHRERTQQIRAARIRAAEIAQTGENQGAGGSSSVAGGISSVQGQQFSNLQFIGAQESAGKAFSTAQQEMADAKGVQTLGTGISAIGGTIFKNRQEVSDIFSGDTTDYTYGVQ
jgi:3-keto-L-gulonate-6-phosphate decarboxylase